MHQGENYQDFLMGRGRSIFRSFSYNNQMNLREFFSQKFAILLPLSLQLGTKDYFS